MTTDLTFTAQALARAAALKSAGRLSEAGAVLSDALRDDPTAPAISHELGLIEAGEGKWSEAERFTRAAVNSGGDQYGSSFGQLLTQAGKYEEAQPWLVRALVANSNDAGALACLGVVYYTQQKRAEGLASVSQALAICPDFPWARWWNEQIRAEKNFLDTVSQVLTAFATKKGIDLRWHAGGSVEIEFASASLDANGHPRFTMQLPDSLVVSDLGAAHIFYHEVAGPGYELGLRRFLDLHLISDDVFIDVGAHWGIHSLTAATRLPGEVSVLAVEASPANIERLRHWVERNHLQADIEVIGKAIGDRPGTACLSLSGSSMGHSLRTSGREAGSTSIEVDMTALDPLLADRPRLRWRRFILKIDVEGYELEVLTGARELFSTQEVAAVIWEKSAFHERTLQDQRDRAILDFLETRGFRHFSMEGQGMGMRLIPLDAKHGVCDVFSLARNVEPKERYA